MSDWRQVQNVDPVKPLAEANNRLFYGTPDIPDGPGETTPWRAVVVAGTCLVLNPITQHEAPIAFGAFNCNADWPEAGLVLARKLRQMADDIERRVLESL